MNLDFHGNFDWDLTLSLSLSLLEYVVDASLPKSRRDHRGRWCWSQVRSLINLIYTQPWLVYVTSIDKPNNLIFIGPCTSTNQPMDSTWGWHSLLLCSAKRLLFSKQKKKKIVPNPSLVRSNMLLFFYYCYYWRSNKWKIQTKYVYY